MNPISAIFRLTRRARSVFHALGKLDELISDIEKIRINQGLILSAMNEQRTDKQLKEYEFGIFSQWGEDGIIQHLVKTVEIKNKTFIEFGVEDFSESNCRFLLIKDNWKGFVIDGSTTHIEALRATHYFWKFDLNAISAFITRENVNELLSQSNFDSDVGILSVDIDGNDFHVLEAVSYYRPRILICEYNAVFGAHRRISVPYESDFNRTAKHYSNLYFGASLAAISYLAKKKGYTLIGASSTGANAFFVRNDLVNDRLLSMTAEQAYFPSNFRQSRDKDGELTHLSTDDSLNLIKGLQVYNVETMEMESL